MVRRVYPHDIPVYHRERSRSREKDRAKEKEKKDKEKAQEKEKHKEHTDPLSCHTMSRYVLLRYLTKGSIPRLS